MTDIDKARAELVEALDAYYCGDEAGPLLPALDAFLDAYLDAREAKRTSGAAISGGERAFTVLASGAVSGNGCGKCYRCLDDPSEGFLNPVMTQMVLCPTCGNKRCPKATYHGHECTASNDLGQPGSRYELGGPPAGGPGEAGPARAPDEAGTAGPDAWIVRDQHGGEHVHRVEPMGGSVPMVAASRLTALESALTKARSVIAAREEDVADMTRQRDEAKQAAVELEMQLNTPELHDFSKAVVLEAAHQRARWGSEHDAGKEPSDWYWLLGYLSGKALRSHIGEDVDKALHHCISSAAVLANWHAAISGSHTRMRPGIADPAPDALPDRLKGEGAECQWKREDDEGNLTADGCTSLAEYVSCKPFAGSLTCAAHKCRCAKRMPAPKETP